MDRATTFAIDFASFELVVKAFLFFPVLARAHKTDQFLVVMIFEIFQCVCAETLGTEIFAASLASVKLCIIGCASILLATTANNCVTSLLMVFERHNWPRFLRVPYLAHGAGKFVLALQTQQVCTTSSRLPLVIQAVFVKPSMPQVLTTTVAVIYFYIFG